MQSCPMAGLRARVWWGLHGSYVVGIPFLFGDFSLVDAFFAPVVMRFATYDVELPPPTFNLHGRRARGSPS